MAKTINFRNKHFLALAGNVIIALFSIITMSVLYRALNKSDIGSWFFFLGIYGFTDAIRNGFLSTAIIKFYAGTDESTSKKVLGSGWFLAAVLTGIILALNMIAWYFSNQFSNPQMTLVIHWVGLTFISSMPYVFTCWILIADEAYIDILFIRLINSVLMISTIVCMTLIKTISLENLLIINFVTNVITSFYCIIRKKTYISTLFLGKKENMIEMIHFGKYSLATNLTSNLLSTSSTFMITFFLGPAALAIYNLPQRLMEVVELPLRSFVGTGMSSMAIHLNNDKKEEAAFIFKKFAGMLTFAFIPIILGGILFADLAIQILGGSKYMGTEAATIFRIFIAFSIFYPIDRFNGITLDLIHQPKLNFQKVILMVIITIICGCLGLYFMKNLYGMAFAFPCALFAGLIFGYYSLKKHLPYKNAEIIAIGWKESRHFLQSAYEKWIKK